MRVLPRFHYGAKVTALALNAFFLVCACLLMTFTILAVMSPPPADISPSPVGTMPEYIITIILLGIFSTLLFMLSLLGILSLLSNSSFFLSLNIICLLAMIATQFIILLFTFSIRWKIEESLIQTWDNKDPLCVFNSKSTAVQEIACRPLSRFRRSEKLWYLWFSFNFLIQIALLICSIIVCERLSYEELRKDYENRAKEPEDEDQD